MEERLGAASGFFASGESYCFEVEGFAAEAVDEAGGVTGFGAGVTIGLAGSCVTAGFGGSGVLTGAGAGFAGSGAGARSGSDTSGGDNKLSCPNNESISTSSGAEYASSCFVSSRSRIDFKLSTSLSPLDVSCGFWRIPPVPLADSACNFVNVLVLLRF
jgi:hypothetical protein